MDVFVMTRELSYEDKRKYYTQEYARLAAIATDRLIASLVATADAMQNASDAMQDFADAQPKKIAGLQL